jgi:RNA polymerase sigma factor (sigma-70 family)
MNRGAASSVLREIRTLYTFGTMGGRTDAELLERFLARGEGDAEDAFATLVARHGPMVLGVCRRMLPASHDAEDAFQATFLVLVRRAASIVRRESLASWLYGVAVRTAKVARRRTARERAAKRRLMDASELTTERPEDREDLLPILDEELNRLPYRYRVALVACELEGKSRREAAEQLGIPEGTLSTHLARGRKLLRERLQRRGVSLGLGPITGLTGPFVETAVPERLIGPIVRAALVDSSGAGATVIVSTAVTSLAERVLKMMFLARLTLIVAALMTTAAGTITAVALSSSTKATESPKVDAPRAGPDARVGARVDGVGVGGVAAAADKDRYGDPLPEGTVARLGSVQFRARDGAVKALRFSPDGQALLTVGEGSILRLWETKTGRLLNEVRPGPSSIYVHSVAFSPDGQQIALSGSRRTDGDPPGYELIRLLVDATSGKEVRRLPVADRDGEHALAFTPDGKYLMSLGNGGILRIEEVASGTEVLQQKLPPDILPSLVVSPDGKVVAIWSGPNSRKLYLWDWQGGAEPREVKVGGRRLRFLDFHPDGKTLAAAGDMEPFVCEWDVATGRLRNQFDLRDDVTPAMLAFSPDGQMMAVSDSGNHTGRNFSGGVLLLERGTGKVVREWLTPGTQPIHVVFSPDGRWLAAVTEGNVHVWDPRRGDEVAPGGAGHQSRLMQIATAPGGLIATAGDDHTVRIWDAATGTERRRLLHGHWVRAVALSADGRFLVSSSLDDSVRLWDPQTGREIYKLPGHGAHGGHRAVGFAPDSRRFLSWGDDLYLRIWDVKTGKALIENAVRPPGAAVAKGDDPGERERAMTKMATGPAAFAADGQRLIVALSASFHIIEAATGRVERSVKNPGGHVVTSLAVAPDGRYFATSGWGRSIERKLPDGRMQSTTPNHHPVCLVELATGKLVRELEMPTPDAGPVAFSADGKLLAIGFGRGSGEVRLLDMATQQTVAELTDFGSAPHAMTFSTDGKYLITGLIDGSALVWDLAHVLAKKARKEGR